MTGCILTLGYEGLTQESFIARLRAVGVQTVVDVRTNPISRKRGFSKRGLGSALSDAGLAYQHLPAMGCPKPVRDRYKRDDDWSAYTHGFLAYLSTQADAVAKLAVAAKASSSCLICFEADFNRCHRTYVARAAADLSGFDIVHLTGRGMIADRAARRAA
jgi:uncharacterized protein (DUF488 family)